MKAVILIAQFCCKSINKKSTTLGCAFLISGFNKTSNYRSVSCFINTVFLFFYKL